MHPHILHSSKVSKALSESSTPGYINLWAAKALLSRVYLTQGDNQKSLDVAEDIIKNSPYKLWKNEETVFLINLLSEPNTVVTTGIPKELGASGAVYVLPYTRTKSK